MDANERLLSRTETYKKLNCSATTLWELTAKGLLPAVRIGRSVKYRSADIDRFIEAHLDSPSEVA